MNSYSLMKCQCTIIYEKTLIRLSLSQRTILQEGFGLSYSRSSLPPPVKLPGDGFEGFEYAPAFNFGAPEILENM